MYSARWCENVRSASLADISERTRDVCFTLESGHARAVSIDVRKVPLADIRRCSWPRIANGLPHELKPSRGRGLNRLIGRRAGGLIGALQ